MLVPFHLQKGKAGSCIQTILVSSEFQLIVWEKFIASFPLWISCKYSAVLKIVRKRAWKVLENPYCCLFLLCTWGKLSAVLLALLSTTHRSSEGGSGVKQVSSSPKASMCCMHRAPSLPWLHRQKVNTWCTAGERVIGILDDSINILHKSP